MKTVVVLSQEEYATLQSAVNHMEADVQKFLDNSYIKSELQNRLAEIKKILADTE